MRHARRLPVRSAVAALALALVTACSGVYLFDERDTTKLPVDKTISLVGSFCSPGTNSVVSPIKIVVALDTSLSMNVNDPDGDRAVATVNLINSLPQDPNVYVAVMLFAGSTTAWLTKSQTPSFDQVTSITAADKLVLEDEILNLTNVTTLPNRDSTDFVKPLSDIYAAINVDIANGLNNPQSASAAARARYSAIFMSDGAPTQPQDDQLIQGDAVTRIRDLSDLCGGVSLNTVHVYEPVQPASTVCNLDPDAGPVVCPMLDINTDTQRLQEMATLGGGQFRDFRNNEAINFLNFDLGQLRRAYVLKTWSVTNVNAPVDSPDGIADSDGDGLTDDVEAKLGTNPLMADTDGDGFSDGVEVAFAKQGAPLDPLKPNIGCATNLLGVDTDCDGLMDCDEQIIGTNSTLTDSDGDGIPDATEWQIGTQPGSADMSEDPDNDGLLNLDEARYHTNPGIPDTLDLTVKGYRYSLSLEGPPDATGAQCYDFRVDNISLANTLADTRDGGTGRGAGFNTLRMAVSFVPADNTSAPTIVQTFTSTGQARYPVGGIKLPVNGVIPVTPEDFINGCPPSSATPAP